MGGRSDSRCSFESNQSKSDRRIKEATQESPEIKLFKSGKGGEGLLKGVEIEEGLIV